MPTNLHTHNMQPFMDKNAQAIYKCTSCEFKCTARALDTVQANTKKHMKIAAKDPQARRVYDI